MVEPPRGSSATRRTARRTARSPTSAVAMRPGWRCTLLPCVARAWVLDVALSDDCRSGRAGDRRAGRVAPTRSPRLDDTSIDVAVPASRSGTSVGRPRGVARAPSHRPAGRLARWSTFPAGSASERSSCRRFDWACRRRRRWTTTSGTTTPATSGRCWSRPASSRARSAAAVTSSGSTPSPSVAEPIIRSRDRDLRRNLRPGDHRDPRRPRRRRRRGARRRPGGGPRRRRASLRPRRRRLSRTRQPRRQRLPQALRLRGIRPHRQRLRADRSRPTTRAGRPCSRRGSRVPAFGPTTRVLVFSVGGGDAKATSRRISCER